LISGLGQVHSSEVIRPHDDGRGGGSEAGERVFRMAGCRPADIDVAQLYDAFTPRVVHDLVAYGFAAWEEVGPLAAAGELTVGGRLPCNTAGGLLSEGHLSGMGHVAEAVRQVRGPSRCQVPDLPGHGQSAKPDAPYTIDFYAGVIRSLGRELGVREAVVMGNSLGGQIAIELGLSYPTWTRALVLAAPAGGFASAVRTFGWAI